MISVAELELVDFFRSWIVFEQFGDFVCGIEWPLLRLVGGGDVWEPSWR